jgi:hypothetical protein
VAGNAALLAFQIFGFIILLYLMHQMYDRLRRDARAAGAATDGPESAHLRAGVGDLVRELRQAAEEINADMASRASTLQKLVDEANETLRRLDAAARRGGTASRQARSAPAQRAAGAAANGARSAHVASAADESLHPLGEGQAEGPVGAGRVPSPGGYPPAGDPPSPRGRVEAAAASPRGVSSRRVGTESGSAAAFPPAAESTSDGPWPGAPVGAPAVQVPRVAAGSTAAASAYRQSAAPFVPVDLADTGRFQAVRRLSDQGLSTTEIARTIGLGREEVELIMRVSGEPS